MFVEEFTTFLRNTLTVPPELPIQFILLNATQKNGIMVMTPINGFNKSGFNGEIFFGRIQIIIRNINIKTGGEIAMQIYDVLNDESNSYNIKLDNYRIKRLYCPELPVGYPRNDADLYEYSLLTEVVFIREQYCTVIGNMVE